MSLRNSASRNSRRPGGAVSAATQSEFEMEMETELQEDPVPSSKAESTPRGRRESAITPTSGRSKPSKRSKSVAKLSERRKSISRRDSTHAKEDENEKLMKFVDKLATEREEREKVDKRVEELEAALAALKTSSAAYENGLKQSLGNAQTQLSQLQEAEKQRGQEQVAEATKLGKSQQDLAESQKKLAEMEGRHDFVQGALNALRTSSALESAQIEKLKKDIETVMKERDEAMQRSRLKMRAQKEHAITSSKLKDIQSEQKMTQEREKVLVKERDAAVSKQEQLKSDMMELEREHKSDMTELREIFKPISRMVVICVDCSGSLSGVIDEIQQCYRDVVLYLKAKCSDAKVAVIIHGSSHQTVYRPHIIAQRTLSLLRYRGNAGSEDYSYCLGEAHKILAREVADRKVVVMIGDGDALYESEWDLKSAVQYLSANQIPAHSIVIPNGNSRYSTGGNTTMGSISKDTGGRTESKDTYFSVLDEFVGGK